MSNPIISIIVPVYNVSKYLDNFHQCIIEQTFKDYEVIYVDDGSTDDSGAKCDLLCSHLDNFHVIHKKNGGLSSARNAGMKVMQGEWITFLDPDDKVVAEYLEKLYNMTSNEVDQVFGNYMSVDDGGNRIDSASVHENITGMVSRNEALSWVFNVKYFWAGYAWGKLFRGSVIKAHHLLFDEEQMINEDGVWTVLFHCNTSNKVVFTTEPLYVYNAKRPGSLMNQGISIEKKLSELVGCIKMYNCIIGSSANTLKLNILSSWYAYVVYRRTVDIVHQYNYEEQFVLAAKNMINPVLNPFKKVLFSLMWHIKK